MNTNIEILVVDDIAGAAADFAELIHSRYGFGVITTDNPLKAIEYVKTLPIKVAVLDQKMPTMTGIQLYTKIREVNPHIQAIMLSGEADSQEVADAMGLGYQGYLSKINIAQLPEKVLDLYVKFEVDFSKQFKVADFPIVLSDHMGVLSRIFFPRHSINFHLVNTEVLDDSFLFQDKWLSIVEVNAGQTIEVEESITLEESVMINHDFEHKLKSEFSVSEKKLDILKLNVGR